MRGIKNLKLSLSHRLIAHSEYDNAITTSIQAKYDLGEKITFRSSYAQGYRSPTLKELYLEFIDINHYLVGNTNLSPERSIDYQLTLDYHPNHYLNISFNSYKTQIKNRIALSEFENLKFEYANVDRYDVFGFQPNISLMGKNLKMNTGASLSYWSTNIKAESIPVHGQVFDMNTSFDYQWTAQQVSFRLNHRYAGSQPRYRLEDEKIVVSTLASYHLLDCSVSKSFGKNRINMIAGIRNLTNTQSIANGNSAGGGHTGGNQVAINVGRSYFFSLQMNWK